MNNKSTTLRVEKSILIIILIIILSFLITSCNLLIKMEKSDSLKYDLTTEEGINDALIDENFKEELLTEWYRNMPDKVDNPELGDVNRDGDVDFIDAIMVSYFYVGITPFRYDNTYADVNYTDPRNIGVDIIDAFLIAKYNGGLIDTLPWAPSS